MRTYRLLYNNRHYHSRVSAVAQRSAGGMHVGPQRTLAHSLALLTATSCNRRRCRLPRTSTAKPCTQLNAANHSFGTRGMSPRQLLRQQPTSPFVLASYLLTLPSARSKTPAIAIASCFDTLKKISVELSKFLLSVPQELHLKVRDKQYITR